MSPARPHGRPVRTPEDDYWESTTEDVLPLSAWFLRRHPSLGNVTEDGDSCVASEAEKMQSPESAF